MLTLSTGEWSNRCDDSSVEVSWKKFKNSRVAAIGLAGYLGANIVGEHLDDVLR
jgi:hypothetical protein